MSWVSDLVNNVSLLTSYVIPGYICVAIYQYVLYKDNPSKNEYERIVFNSIAISLFIKLLVEGVFRITYSGKGYLFMAMSLFFGLVIGYLAAKIVNANWFQHIRRFFGINRTINDNVWDDILVQGQWLRVWLKDSECSYAGQVKYMENCEREPLVVLEYYQFLDENAQVLEDNTCEDRKNVMLNLREFDRVEIINP